MTNFNSFQTKKCFTETCLTRNLKWFILKKINFRFQLFRIPKILPFWKFLIESRVPAVTLQPIQLLEGIKKVSAEPIVQRLRGLFENVTEIDKTGL